MKKRGEFVSYGELADDGFSAINYMISLLEKQIKKLDEAHSKKDAIEFNRLKKEVLKLQREIHSRLG